MIAPYAKVLASINSGADDTGAVTAATGDTLDLSLESSDAVSICRWEIYGYPPAFTEPTGWETDDSTGAFYFLGLVPDQVTLDEWGKYMIRATINGGVTRDRTNSPAVDESTIVTIPSDNGLADMGYLEDRQVSAEFGAVADHQANLRVVQTALEAIDAINAALAAAAEVFENGVVTLASGVGTISDSNATANTTVVTQLNDINGGSIALTADRKVTVTPGVGWTVTAVKTDGTTNTADTSILFYSRWTYS